MAMAPAVTRLCGPAAGIEDFREPKIHDFDLVAARHLDDHHVFRFQVAVDDAEVVRVPKSIEQLPEPFGGARRNDHPAPLKLRAPGLARDELHDQIRAA